MQYYTFQQVLEGLEAGDDPAVFGVSARHNHLFESPSAPIFTIPNSGKAETGIRRTNAMSAYDDHDVPEDEKPVHRQPDQQRPQPASPRVKARPKPQPKPRPMTLDQLKSGLGSKLSIKELGRLRRQFAFENHPDRVPEHERLSASKRLAIANDLVDHAIRKASSGIISQEHR